MQSLAGYLLVALPNLMDPNFFRTVVLMVQHNEQGALGVVLNRPSGKKLHEVWEQVSESPCPGEPTLHIGGPVQGPLIALHGEAAWADIELLPGVYFSTERENIEHVVAQNEPTARLFAGYAGWSAGQLENEIETGSWLTTAATAAHIFDADVDLWQRVSKEIADAIILPAARTKHVPQDPSVN